MSAKDSTNLRDATLNSEAPCKGGAPESTDFSPVDSAPATPDGSPPGGLSPSAHEEPTRRSPTNDEPQAGGGGGVPPFTPSSNSPRDHLGKKTLLAPMGDEKGSAVALGKNVRKKIRKEGVQITIPSELEDIASRLDLQTFRLFYAIAKLQKAGYSTPGIIKTVGADPDLVQKILHSSVYQRMYSDMRGVDAATHELDALEAQYREHLPEVRETELYWARRRGVADGHVSLRACQQIKQGAGFADGRGNVNQAAAVVNIQLTEELTGRLEKALVEED